MFIKYPAVILSALLLIQPVFADDDMGMSDGACATVVKACLDGGYTRDAAAGKQFWFDCMKPMLMGKTVANMTMDAKAVKACRTAKIKQLEQELKQLKKAK